MLQRCWGLPLGYRGSHLLLMTQGNSLQVTLDLTPDLRVVSPIISVAIVTGLILALRPHGVARGKIQARPVASVVPVLLDMSTPFG